MAGWNDVPHLDAKTKAELLSGTPVHLQAARSRGIPTQGSGAVFPVPEETIRFDVFAMPEHWPRIAGMDYGWEHPTAAVWIAWDRDTDTVYVYDGYRVKHQTPVVHAAALKSKGLWIPMSWPADGHQTEKGTGIQLAEQYRTQGLNMLPEQSQFDATEQTGETRLSRVSVEAGVMEMLTRMQTGRFKVASHLNDWWEEFRLYHRKEGRIVKEKDDLLSATRYAIMDLRYAALPPKPRSGQRGPANWRT